MPDINVTTAAAAAEEKGCSDKAIYAALDRGALNAVRMGGTRLVLKDDLYDAYQPRPRRKHAIDTDSQK